ncbi:MAG: hypothetical protein KDE03_03665 [Rhodobacteraceae bacterium]|nr:hypothetical protein [Paracoccaceae bacterium]
MPDFTLHTPDTAPDGSRDALAAVTKAWGFTPKLHAILAESPAALIGYDTLFGLIAQSSLSPVEQQVVYQSINVFHGCEYCTMGHTYLQPSRRVPLDAVAAAPLTIETQAEVA